MRRTYPEASICGIHSREGKNLDQLVHAGSIEATPPRWRALRILRLVYFVGGEESFDEPISDFLLQSRRFFREFQNRQLIGIRNFWGSRPCGAFCQFDNNRVRMKERREVVPEVFVAEKCLGRFGELDAFFTVHIFKTCDLLPTARHPYPSPGTTLPFALNVDRRCSRTSDPAPRHPDVVCSGPSPIPSCPDIF